MKKFIILILGLVIMGAIEAETGQLKIDKFDLKLQDFGDGTMATVYDGRDKIGVLYRVLPATIATLNPSGGLLSCGVLSYKSAGTLTPIKDTYKIAVYGYSMRNCETLKKLTRKILDNYLLPLKR